MSWREVLIVAHEPEARQNQLLAVKARVPRADWVTVEHVVAVLHLVARRLGADSLTAGEYRSERARLLATERYRPRNDRWLLLPDDEQVIACAGSWDAALVLAGLAGAQDGASRSRPGAPTLVDLVERFHDEHGFQPSARDLRAFARGNGVPYPSERAQRFGAAVAEWVASRSARGLPDPRVSRASAAVASARPTTRGTLARRSPASADARSGRGRAAPPRSPATSHSSAAPSGQRSAATLTGPRLSPGSGAGRRHDPGRRRLGSGAPGGAGAGGQRRHGLGCGHYSGAMTINLSGEEERLLTAYRSASDNLASAAAANHRTASDPTMLEDIKPVDGEGLFVLCNLAAVNFARVTIPDLVFVKPRKGLLGRQRYPKGYAADLPKRVREVQELLDQLLADGFVAGLVIASLHGESLEVDSKTAIYPTGAMQWFWENASESIWAELDADPVASDMLQTLSRGNVALLSRYADEAQRRLGAAPDPILSSAAGEYAARRGYSLYWIHTKTIRRG